MTFYIWSMTFVSDFLYGHKRFCVELKPRYIAIEDWRHVLSHEKKNYSMNKGNTFE